MVYSLLDDGVKMLFYLFEKLPIELFFGCLHFSENLLELVKGTVNTRLKFLKDIPIDLAPSFYLFLDFLVVCQNSLGSFLKVTKSFLFINDGCFQAMLSTIETFVDLL